MRRSMLLLVLLLAFNTGCGPDEETGCTGDEDEDVDADGDGYCASTDCDESNPDINPGQAEVCNEIDDNCNGGMDEEEITDADNDGVVTCKDCDDFDGALFPGNPEVCNGIDDDCDGAPGDDEGDADGDGHLTCADCDDDDPAVNPGAIEVACNGIDDNCNGELHPDELDGDGDGTTACDGDCAPDDGTVGPGLPETCNGEDDDCDELLPPDEQDADQDGVSECAGDCDESNSAVFPGATEVCDGYDNDCDDAYFEAPDGTTELTDGDGDTWAPCEGDCDDGDSAVNPAAYDVLDSPDDANCDSIAGGLSAGFNVVNTSYDVLLAAVDVACFLHDIEVKIADFEAGPDASPVAVSQQGVTFFGTYGTSTFGWVFEDEASGFLGFDGSDFFGRPEAGVSSVTIEFSDPQTYVVFSIGGFDSSQYEGYQITPLWNDVPLAPPQQLFGNSLPESWTSRGVQSLNNVGFNGLRLEVPSPPNSVYLDDLLHCH
jgi:hypothetical protein